MENVKWEMKMEIGKWKIEKGKLKIEMKHEIGNETESGTRCVKLLSSTSEKIFSPESPKSHFLISLNPTCSNSLWREVSSYIHLCLDPPKKYLNLDSKFLFSFMLKHPRLFKNLSASLSIL